MLDNLSHHARHVNNALRRNANAGDRTPASLHAETGDREARGTQARKAVAPAGILDDVADGIEAIHQIANLAGYTERPRDFIFALATAAHSHGQYQLELYDEELAELQNCSTKTVQRQRADYIREAKTKDFDLVEIIEGDYEKTEEEEGKPARYRLPPTRYRFHIGDVIERIVAEARASKFWHESDRRKQREAVKRAAQVIYDADEIPRSNSRLRKKRRPRLATAEIKTCLKTAETNIRRMKEIMTKLPPHMRAELMDTEDRKKWFKLRGEVDSLFIDSPQPIEVREDDMRGGQVVWAFSDDVGSESVGLVPDASSVTRTEPEEMKEPSSPPVSPLPPRESRDTGGAAEATLQVFESVGVTEFKVTLKDERAGAALDCVTYTGACLRAFLPGLLKRNAERAESIIVRPWKHGPGLIQADDLTGAEIEKVRHLAFAIAETSHQNFQAWFDVADADETTRRRLLLALDADRGASGAMRLPGSRNMKPLRDGFPIRLVATAPGRQVYVADLERAGLLAPLPCPPPPTVERPRPMTRAPRFPDYARCLADKGDDHNRADAAFVKIAMCEGFTDSEAWAELERVAPREKLQRADYRRRTLSFCSAP